MFDGSANHVMKVRRSAQPRVALGFVLALVGVAIALGGTGPSIANSRSAGTRSAATAKRYSYCSRQNAIFKDPRPFVGISDPFVQTGTPLFRNCSFGRMAADHIGYFRAGLAWAGVEWKPNSYHFGAYDELVAELADHHMRFLPILIEPPAWASTQPHHSAIFPVYPPRHAVQFAYFASLCVQRYGPGGTFWRTHPQLPYYPVRAWEVWNEPNLASYWAPKPNARAYLRLLRATSDAIKRVDSHAIVVMAGMPFVSSTAESSYYTQLYRDGVRGAFDALALHAYSVTVQGALGRLLTARKVMNGFGDQKKAIWLTEWGWAGGPPNPYRVSATGQRENIAAFLGLVQRYRAKLGLREMMYFDWHDNVFGPGPKDYWIYHLGLLTLGLRPKPALGAFSLAARRLDR